MIDISSEEGTCNSCVKRHTKVNVISVKTPSRVSNNIISTVSIRLCEDCTKELFYELKDVIGTD